MKDLLARLPIDLAKFGVILYLLGLFTSAFYFSRYSVLALDFTRPQAIVIGAYILLFYGVLPALSLFLLKNVTSAFLQMIAFWLALCAKNTVLMYSLDYPLLQVCVLALLTSLIEFLFFAHMSSLLRSVGKKRFALTLSAIPSQFKALVFAIIFSVHFAIFIFPLIPFYLGGAKPFKVQVFCKTPDLAANDFVTSKNQPKVNPSIDSFKLFLFYESDKDYYFVEELTSEWGLEGYSVMRIKRDEVLRIDYNTPKWVSMKGAEE